MQRSVTTKDDWKLPKNMEIKMLKGGPTQTSATHKFFPEILKLRPLSTS